MEGPSPPPKQLHLHPALEAVSEPREQVSKIGLVTAEDEEGLIAIDPVATRTLADLIPEPTFIALRHGRATKITFPSR